MKKIVTLFLFAAMLSATLFAQTDSKPDFSSVCSIPK